MEARGLAQHTAAMQTTTASEPLRVFLVEDAPAIRDRLLALLDAIPGARVVGHAGRADDAIARIAECLPDAVVLDLNLAHGSGIDVLRALRHTAPFTAIYVLTNFATAPYRRLCTTLGARGFYDKSTEFEAVRDAVAAQALHRSEPPGRTPCKPSSPSTRP